MRGSAPISKSERCLGGFFHYPACDYTCDSYSALNCHMLNMHGFMSEASRCVNSATCSVCGLVFSGVANNREHVGVGGSKICLHNLLQRGAFVSEAEVATINEEIAAARRVNFAKGFNKSKVKFRCTRSLGPLMPAYGLDGVAITPHKGNPIGSGQLRLPYHLLVLDTDNSFCSTTSCPAARFSPCTGQCVLCFGQQTSSSGVLAS